MNRLREIQEQQTRMQADMLKLGSPNFFSNMTGRERFMVFHAWKILNARVPNDVGLDLTPNRVGHLKAIVTPLPRSSARLQTLHVNSFVVHAATLEPISGVASHLKRTRMRL